VRAEGTFRGALASFTELRALAESFGVATGTDRETTLRVVLVLEELFTNTVIHGYAGDEGPVWVTLVSQRDVIAVTYEDAAPPFDPVGHSSPPTLAPEARAPGGLGLTLVRGLCVSASYARVDDRNRITLAVATSSAAAR